MPIIVDLEGLNSLRTLNGKAPLKSWKESKAKLAQAYANEEHAAHNAEHAAHVASIAAKANVSEQSVKDTVARLAAEAVAANKKIARDVEVTDAAKAAVKKMYAPRKSATQKIAEAVAAAKTRVKTTKATINATRAKENTSTIVNVAAIAKELGLNAKIARATIRRKNVDRTDAAAIRAALKK